MPHGLDVDDSRTLTEYECLRCGTIVEAPSSPGDCDCGGGFQSREKSLE